MGIIYLPWPVSTNSMYRSIHGRSILSKPARAWTTEAGKRLVAQKPKSIKGPVRLSLVLCAPTRRAYDLDNHVKIVLDLLVAHGVIEDDNNRIVKRLEVEEGVMAGKTGSVQITVVPLSSVVVPLVTPYGGA